MKKIFYFFPTLVGAMLSMSSCSSDEDYSPANPGDAIQFTAVTPQTRTVYEGPLKLNWVQGDLIGIYSAQAIKPAEADPEPYAPYVISNVIEGGDHDNHGVFTPQHNTNRLQWGSYNAHTFYAAYPETHIMGHPGKNQADGEGVFQMKYITHQLCSIDNNKTENTYATIPDMKNAYMAATNTIALTTPKNDDHVLLNFRPIMTTLDITVTAGKTSEDVGTGIIPAPTTITGVSVILPKALKDGVFKYDIKNSALLQGTVVDNRKEAVFITLEKDNNKYLRLNAGESVRFLAFLPPMLIDGGTDNKAKIRIHTTGYQNYIITLNGKLDQQSKINVPLPDFDPENIQSNNWLSEIDDKVLVSSLSIPGAFNAVSMEGTGIQQSSQASHLSITNMLNMGVRAFDIKDNAKLTSVIKEVEAFLKAEKNKNEFVLVRTSNMLNVNNGVIPYQKGMTLSDVRGKIVAVASEAAAQGITQYPFTNAERVIEHLTAAAGNKNTLSITDCATEKMTINEIAISNNKIYTHITDTVNKGNTGVVMVPYACTPAVDKIAVQGDLLIQSIIDCNYKFLHK